MGDLETTATRKKEDRRERSGVDKAVKRVHRSIQTTKRAPVIQKQQPGLLRPCRGHWEDRDARKGELSALQALGKDTAASVSNMEGNLNHDGLLKSPLWGT